MFARRRLGPEVEQLESRLVLSRLTVFGAPVETHSDPAVAAQVGRLTVSDGQDSGATAAVTEREAGGRSQTPPPPPESSTPEIPLPAESDTHTDVAVLPEDNSSSHPIIANETRLVQVPAVVDTVGDARPRVDGAISPIDQSETQNVDRRDVFVVRPVDRQSVETDNEDAQSDVGFKEVVEERKLDVATCPRDADDGESSNRDTDDETSREYRGNAALAEPIPSSDTTDRETTTASRTQGATRHDTGPATQYDINLEPSSASSNASGRGNAQSATAADTSVQQPQRASSGLDQWLDQTDSRKDNSDDSVDPVYAVAAANLFVLTLSRPFNRLGNVAGSDSNSVGGGGSASNDAKAPVPRRRRRSILQPGRWSPIDDYPFGGSYGPSMRLDDQTESLCGRASQTPALIDAAFIDEAVMTLLDTSDDHQHSAESQGSRAVAQTTLNARPGILLVGVVATVGTTAAITHRHRRARARNRLAPALPVYNGPTVQG